MERNLSAELFLGKRCWTAAVNTCPVFQLPDADSAAFVSRFQRVEDGAALTVWEWDVAWTTVCAVRTVLAFVLLTSMDLRVRVLIRALTTIIAEAEIVDEDIIGKPACVLAYDFFPVFRCEGAERIQR